MTRQEIFDKVATHLLDQSKLSMRSTRGMYYGPDGTNCSVGCLLPQDKETREAFSDSRFNSVPLEVLIDSIEEGTAPAPIPAETVELLRREWPLINLLQETHDSYCPVLWGRQLLKVADTHGLNADVVTSRNNQEGS